MIAERNELLAKLMSTEDIDVEQLPNVPTAYFDLDKRKLVIPMWENLTVNETELIIGHEIGHALYTDSAEWKAAIDSFGGNKSVFKNCLNVIEDARIERMVKMRYPGMSRVFTAGYTELFNRGIFGKENTTLLNRINLFYKVPLESGISKAADMESLINMIDRAKTFSDVIECATALYASCEEEHENQKQEQKSEEGSAGEKSQSQPQSMQSDEKKEGAEEESEQSSQSEETAEETSEEASEDGSNAADNSSSGSQGSFGTGQSVAPTFEEQYGKDIEEDLNNFLNQQLSDKSDNVIYAYMPKVNLDKIIVGYKEVMKEFNKRYSFQTEEVEEEQLPEVNADMTKFAKTRRSTINFYKQIFEMRKKAIEHKRTMQFKTGKLDMSKLSQYKFTENMFLTNEIKDKGKNHGLVFFVDFSGSMQPNFYPTMLQLLEIVSFCRESGIPVQAFGFSDVGSYAGSNTKFECDPKIFSNFVGTPFQLIELFNPKMTNSEFVKMFNYLVSRKYNHNRYFQLGGTPLNSSILCVPEIVNRFRAATRAQIVNVVYLTDGGAGDALSGDLVRSQYNYNTQRYIYSTVILVDRKTKKQVNINQINEKAHKYARDPRDFTAAALEMARKILKDVSIVNFNIYNDGRIMAEKADYCGGFDEWYEIASGTMMPMKTQSFSSMHEGMSRETAMDVLNRQYASRAKLKMKRETIIRSFIDKIC